MPIRYAFIRDGKEDTRTGWQWVHAVREIRALLAEPGLRVLETAGTLDGAPYERGGPYLLIVAERS